MSSASFDHVHLARAIAIPHQELYTEDYASHMHHRRRRGRHSLILEPIDHSDVGPSSVGSDSSSNSPHLQHRTITSSAHITKDPRLPQQPAQVAQERDPDYTSQRKDKAKASEYSSSPSSLPPLFPPSTSPLGPSMLESSSYKSINLNDQHDPDEPPRLITYTKVGQGFTWNDELFLPSYMINRYGGRGRRKQYDGDFGDDEVEVTEIFVTDEEAAAMMP